MRGFSLVIIGHEMGRSDRGSVDQLVETGDEALHDLARDGPVRCRQALRRARAAHRGPFPRALGSAGAARVAGRPPPRGSGKAPPPFRHIGPAATPRRGRALSGFRSTPSSWRSTSRPTTMASPTKTACTPSTMPLLSKTPGRIPTAGWSSVPTAPGTFSRLSSRPHGRAPS